MNKWKRFLQNKKNLVILLLGILCVLRVPQGGVRFALWVLVGILTCSATDMVLSRVFRKKKPSLQSAIISGFIVSGILDYNLDWYVLIAFSALAIVSKFIIRIKNKHVFNPANFGLFVAAILKQPLTWNIESNIHLIIIVGVYLALSLKKWPHVLGFLIVFLSAFYISGVNPLNMISWFFLFVMLIEPKTSGFGTWKGLTFGGIAGLMSFIMFKFMPQLDIFVISLIVANIFNTIAGTVKLSNVSLIRARK